MCLNLKGASSHKLKKAKKDIIVYKILSTQTLPVLASFVKHGDSFKGTLRGKRVSGKVSIVHGVVHFCQNKCSGQDIENKLGYRFSWLLDTLCINLRVNNQPAVINKSSLVTYYMEFPVVIGETYTSELVKKGNMISEGLHSFKDMKIPHTRYEKDLTLVKCIIPKGSTYYTGVFMDNMCYASDTLKYVEIIDRTLIK